MSISLSLEPNDCGHRDISLDDGTKVGHFALGRVPGRGAYFEQIYINPQFRGQGLGKSTYKAVIDEVSLSGDELISDPESFSVGALGVWSSLARDGLALQNGTAEIDELGDVYGVQFTASKITDVQQLAEKVQK